MKFMATGRLAIWIANNNEEHDEEKEKENCILSLRAANPRFDDPNLFYYNVNSHLSADPVFFSSICAKNVPRRRWYAEKNCMQGRTWFCWLRAKLDDDTIQFSFVRATTCQGEI